MIKDNRGGIPFLEKVALPPDNYEIFKFSGELLKDKECGIRIML